MPDLDVVPTPASLLRAQLRRDVRAMADSYDLDDAWIEQAAAGTPAADLTVEHLRRSLGLGDFGGAA